MKRISTYLACLMLASCGTIHTNVGPKPDIKPVMASNQAAQKSIKETRTEIKASQVNIKTGLVGLEAVKRYLEMLMGLPPKEQGIVLLAQRELDKAASQFMEGALRIAKADARADEAERHALDTETYAKTLSGQIDAAHKREEVLAKDNAKMKPVYEECTKWWDLGSGWYFVKHLVKHLLILAGVAVGLLAILSIAASLGVPGLGFALSFAKRLLGGASSLSSRAVTAARNKVTHQ